ncbi:MAG: hypothetical protein WKF96_07650, partial [Solirubrobacteraceae bacterium]
PSSAPPRRVSGPVRGRSTSATVASPPPLALRLGGAVHGLAEHHVLDRLIRGRAWIGILAVGLIGIVFMQVSMLRLNAGIGAAVEKTSTLERQNSALRASISELNAGERIAAEALQLGLVLPSGTPRFLNAEGVVASRAAASIAPPGEGIVPSATTPETPLVDPATSTTPVLGQSGVTATPEPAATTPGTTAPGTAPAATDPSATSEPTTPVDHHAAPPATVTTAPPAQEQAAAPPPTAESGGVDASGQMG